MGKGTIRKEIGEIGERGTSDSIFYRDSRHFSVCRWSQAFFEAMGFLASTYTYISIVIYSCMYVRALSSPVSYTNSPTNQESIFSSTKVAIVFFFT